MYRNKCTLKNKHILKIIITKRFFTKKITSIKFLKFSFLFIFVTALQNSINILYVAKCACFTFVSKTGRANLLNSRVVMHLAWSEILLSTCQFFLLRTAVVTKLLVSGILFSISPTFVLRTVVVTKALTSGTFLSISPIFSLDLLYWFMWIKGLCQELYSLNFSLLYSGCCTLSFYLLIFKSSTFVFKLSKPIWRFIIIWFVNFSIQSNKIPFTRQIRSTNACSIF